MQSERWLKKLLFWLRLFLHRRELDQQLDDEIAYHLEAKTEENMANGMLPEEARRAARIEMGGIEQVKEKVRSVRTGAWLETILQDIRFGLRMLRKNPGFTVVAVLTLGLGIGANTAIFSVANSVFRQGLPAEEPGKILGLSFHQRNDLGQRNFSYPDFDDIREQATSFTEVFAYRIGLDGLKTGDRSEQVITSFVTGNYFAGLGLKAAVGRLILPSEGGVPGSDPVLVLGYSYWQERFGSIPDIVGKQVEVDGRAFTVVGVAPKGFRGLYGAAIDVQAYLPINMFAAVEQRNRGWSTDRTSRSLFIMGRLRAGTSPSQAQASLDVIASRLAQRYPKDWRAASIETYPSEAANSLYDPSRQTYQIARAATGLFLAMAGLVFLLACFNVANILLVRATTREHEMTVRAALGASRGRLIRQILAESILLAIFGGAAGLALGEAASTTLSSIHLRVGVPVRLNFPFDWHVFAFALASALLAGIVVGIVPAVRASRAHPGDALHEGARGIVSGHHYLRNLLVVSQLAGSVVLLVVAGLFARSFQKASGIELGFDPHDVLNISMDPGQLGYDHERGREFYKDLLSRVRSLSGVQSASLAFTFPGSEYSESERVYIEGQLPLPGQSGPTVSDNSVSPGYFKAMRIPILEGRGFRDTDTESAPRVSVINQTMATEYWPGQDPLDKQFKLSSNSDSWIKIVGVVRDSRVVDLTAKVPAYFYLPLDQDYSQLVTLQVRTDGPPEGVIQEVEPQIQMLAPGLPVFGVQTMEQALNGPGGFFHYWLGSVLASVLGLLGLTLAVVGVYGVIAYSVGQRTHEIGVRMALGAQRGEVLKMILGQGLELALAGVGIGIVCALGSTRFLSSLLYGVKPTDPLTLLGVSVILTGMALLASYIPATRAMQVDPMVALRHE